MSSPAIVPAEQLRVSSNTADKELIRPTSSRPWRSSPDDKEPTAGVKFDKPEELGGVGFPKEPKNVKAVRLTVTPEDKNSDVNKVCYF